jgi:hypothetical protein
MTYIKDKTSCLLIELLNYTEKFYQVKYLLIGKIFNQKIIYYQNWNSDDMFGHQLF